MDKNEVLLFIAERLDNIIKLQAGEFAGRVTREEQAMYQQALRALHHAEHLHDGVLLLPSWYGRGVLERRPL